VIAIARTPPAFQNRHRLQLVAALVVGIAIGSVVGTGLTQGRPADAGSQREYVPAAQAPAARATDDVATSASEQYRAPYARSNVNAGSTSASEQYRAPYTRSAAPAATTSAGEQYRASYTGQE
jgi:cell division septation protein DedD